MALHIRSKSLVKERVLITLTAAVALAVQPLYGIMTSPAVNAAPGTVHSADLSGWYLGESRSKGHSEMVTNGLHVWTDSNDYESKAAGYRVTPGLKLADVDSTAINFVSYTDGRPSVQLGVDRDGNGSWDGYLVYEPWAYGEGQYWVNKDGFGVAPGSGYNSMGTLAEYQTANPDANVLSMGYSLGSGLKGEAIISSIVIGETTYSFGLPPIVVPAVNITAPAESSSAATTRLGNTLKVAGSFTDDKAVNYLQLELVRAGNLVTVYTMHYNNPGLTSDGSFAVSIPVPANLASGEYSLYYTGTDFDGGVTARFERKFTIDNNKPTATLIAPTVANQPETVAIQVDATDAVGLKSIVANIYKTGESSPFKSTQTVIGGAASGTHSTNVALPTGSYYIRYNAADIAGNVSSTGTYNFTVSDLTAPNAPVFGVDGLVSGGATNQYSITARWDKPSDDTDRYEYQYWNTVATSPWNESNRWSTSVNGESYAGAFTEGQGMHYMRVRAIDTAGNKSEWSNTFTVTYDTTAPVVALNELPLGTNTTPTISGTIDDPSAVITVTIDGVDAPAVNNGDGTWTYTVSSPLGVGDHTISVAARDAAANQATPATATLTIQAAPIVTNPGTSPGTGTPTAPPEDLGDDDDDEGEDAPSIALNIPGFAATVPGFIATPPSQDTPAPDSANGTNSGVLGEQDNRNIAEAQLADTGEVLGFMDNKLLGFAWYWWLVILGAMVAGWLLLAAAIRRRRERQEV